MEITFFNHVIYIYIKKLPEYKKKYNNKKREFFSSIYYSYNKRKIKNKKEREKKRYIGILLRDYLF